MTVDQGVQTAERVSLLEAAIGPDGRVEILVAEDQSGRLIFAGVFLKEQLRREVPESMRVEVDACLFRDCALDLFGEVLRRLRSTIARREQEAIRVFNQRRSATGQIDVEELAQSY